MYGFGLDAAGRRSRISLCPPLLGRYHVTSANSTRLACGSVEPRAIKPCTFASNSTDAGSTKSQSCPYRNHRNSKFALAGEPRHVSHHMAIHYLTEEL